MTTPPHIICAILIIFTLSSLPPTLSQCEEAYDRLPVGSNSGLEPPGERANICDHCFCSQIKVYCDFHNNHTLSRVWGTNYMLPTRIKSIEVYLKSGTQFQLNEHFFQDNHVNYFGVIGVENYDQVEMTTNAFVHNKGGYPNIEFRNISSVFMREKTLAGNEFKMLVENCGFVAVSPNALRITNLDLTVRKVKDLVLCPGALKSVREKKSLVNLRVEHSGIRQINSFNVSMSKVTYERCTIASIMPNAFQVTNIKELSFLQCQIQVIQANAFTDNFSSDKLSIVNNTIGTIEGMAISHSGVTSLTIEGNKIDKIQSGAIQINAANTYIHNNTVRHMEPLWMSISQAAYVEIADNSFDRFDIFEVKSISQAANCSFAQNDLANPQPGSLNLGGCSIHNNHVHRTCSCDGGWVKALSDHDLDSEILCTLKTNDRECFNASIVNWRRFENEACGGNATRHCAGGQWSTRPLVEPQNTWTASRMVWCILGSVAITSVFTVIVMRMWCRRVGGHAEDCCMSKEERDQLGEEAHKLDKGSESQHTLLQLVKGALRAEDCINCIIKILDGLPPNKPSQVKELLSRHLAQCHPSHGMMQQSDGCYATAVSMAQSAQPSAPSPGPSEHRDDEPIYEDPQDPLIPNGMMRPLGLGTLPHPPLICSDYSSPPYPVENPYTEPFNATHANDMPPAYQYATPMRHLGPPPKPQQPQPPTVVSYATPVWRSTPTATPTSRPPSLAATGQRHVRDLRQDLEAMPQFHPNQLTSARNQRQLQLPQPTYTATHIPHIPPSAHIPPMHQQQQQQQPPPYAQSQRSQRLRGGRSFECLDGAASLAAMEHMDSGSDHSGGSDVTVQISDVIDYADA